MCKGRQVHAHVCCAHVCCAHGPSCWKVHVAAAAGSTCNCGWHTNAHQRCMTRPPPMVWWRAFVGVQAHVCCDRDAALQRSTAGERSDCSCVCGCAVEQERHCCTMLTGPWWTADRRVPPVDAQGGPPVDAHGSPPVDAHGGSAVLGGLEINAGGEWSTSGLFSPVP